MPGISASFNETTNRSVTISDLSNPLALNTTIKGTAGNIKQEKLDETSEHFEEGKPNSPLHAATSNDKIQEGLRQIVANHNLDLI